MAAQPLPAMPSKPQQWYVTNPHRLVLEKKVMEQLHPQFYTQFVDGDKLAWIGDLVSQYSGEKYSVCLVYSETFPSTGIDAFILEPTLDWNGRNPVHIYKNQKLCLFYPGDRSWETNTTGATVVGWVAAWYFCYETYRHVGLWPGRAADAQDIEWV